MLQKSNYPYFILENAKVSRQPGQEFTENQ